MLGVIADDLTGATDAACMIARRGLSVTQVIGPPSGAPQGDADAIVVALKSRSVPSAEAVACSLATLDWLEASGAEQIYFKYCSTFDSTPDGNIGPVAAALATRLDQTTTIFCPGFPENGRTVYRGHIFVDDRLISESSLATHPLNPMTDPDLVRFLRLQSGKTQVRSLSLEDIEAGPDRVRNILLASTEQGGGFLLADTLFDRHIEILAEALVDARLVTGGSPLCGALAGRRAIGGEHAKSRIAPVPQDGPPAILAGSCSQASRNQIDRIAQHHAVQRLDPLALASQEAHLEETIEAASQNILAGKPAIVASSADPEAVAAAQNRLGADRAGEIIETALGDIARALASLGTRVFVVAGGETSSAVARALEVDRLEIGPEITPGVPWTRSLGEPQYRLAFKSGNFGGPDFFMEALDGQRRAS
ncbi:MAG: 3-oxo-tetronate kinase [Pseudomonadota bacterium]